MSDLIIEKCRLTSPRDFQITHALDLFQWKDITTLTLYSVRYLTCAMLHHVKERRTDAVFNVDGDDFTAPSRASWREIHPRIDIIDRNHRFIEYHRVVTFISQSNTLSPKPYTLRRILCSTVESAH